MLLKICSLFDSRSSPIFRIEFRQFLVIFEIFSRFSVFFVRNLKIRTFLVHELIRATQIYFSIDCEMFAMIRSEKSHSFQWVWILKKLTGCFSSKLFTIWWSILRFWTFLIDNPFTDLFVFRFRAECNLQIWKLLRIQWVLCSDRRQHVWSSEKRSWPKKSFCSINLQQISSLWYINHPEMIWCKFQQEFVIFLVVGRSRRKNLLLAGKTWKFTGFALQCFSCCIINIILDKSFHNAPRC